MSSINVNFGGNVGRGNNTNNVTAGSQASQAVPAETNQPSYQNSSPQVISNALSQRMMSAVTVLNAMEAKEFALLVRDLLSLPKEMQQLLAMLATGEDGAEMLKDPKMEFLLKDLQKLLGQNSKDVINKLINLTQNNALFYEGKDQLREVLGFIQKISTIAQISPGDALTTLMVLYLPWLPLAAQQQLDLTFGMQENAEDSSKDGLEILVMFIRTQNIGIFKVTIILEKDKTIEISIENDSVASNMINKIVKQINMNLDSCGLKGKISTLTRKQDETRTPRQMKKESVKGLSIHPSGKISIMTVNTAYKIVKIIFSIDEKISHLNGGDET